MNNNNVKNPSNLNQSCVQPLDEKQLPISELVIKLKNSANKSIKPILSVNPMGSLSVGDFVTHFFFTYVT